MKKTAITLLILTLVFCSVSAAATELKDVKESDWFKDNVTLLYSKNIIQGDGTGNFLPNKQVTGSEYLKMVVVALDSKTYAATDRQQWDKPYIDRALELGLVKAGEITHYRSPLNRYNMARIIVRACDESYGDYNQYQSSIKDFGSVPAEFKEYVLKAYSKGIINGLPDGTFGGSNTMKRSEATAVIARLIDPSQRKTPAKPEKDDKSIKLENEDMQMIVDKISGLVVPEERLGDIIFYSEDGKPSFYKCDLSIMELDSEGEWLQLAVESPTEKTLAKAKEVLRLFYPVRYEEVYKAMLNSKETDRYSENIKDNRKLVLLRDYSGMYVRIGREILK